MEAGIGNCCCPHCLRSARIGLLVLPSLPFPFGVCDQAYGSKKQNADHHDDKRCDRDFFGAFRLAS